MTFRRVSRKTIKGGMSLLVASGLLLLATSESLALDADKVAAIDAQLVNENTAIAFTVSNFAASSTVNVTTTFFTEVSTQVRTDAKGTANGTLAVPDGFSGSVTLTARGSKMATATALPKSSSPNGSASSGSDSSSSSSSSSGATTPKPSKSGYNAAVLVDKPVLFFNMSGFASGAEKDLSASGNNGTYVDGTPKSATLPNGDMAADFDGQSQHVTVPSAANLSLPTTGEFTWEAWIRPDTLQFSTDYVQWMGKCAQWSPTCEWEARMWAAENSQDRCSRFSAYIHNPEAGLGSAANWQPDCNMVQAGKWYHVVGEYSLKDTPSRCDAAYPGSINIWVNGVKWSDTTHGLTGCMSQFSVKPQTKDSPVNIGMMATKYAFPGAIGKVALYDHLLSNDRVVAHFTEMTGQSPNGSCGATCTAALVS